LLTRESPLVATDAFFHAKSIKEVKGAGGLRIQYNSYSLKTGNEYIILLAFTKIISFNLINDIDRNDYYNSFLL